MNIDNITRVSNTINQKFVDISFNPVFVMLIAVKYFEIFRKHKGYFFYLRII